MHRINRRVALLGLALAATQTGAYAQAPWPEPDRPIRLIVGFAAGGGADASARLVSRKMGEILGATIVIENRGGAGGLPATHVASEAKPDGYTLLWGSIGAFAFSPALGMKLGYDPIHGFEPISLTASLSNVLIVGANSKYKTVRDLIAAARAHPGKLTYGSPGVGSAGHISGQLFTQLAKINMIHVPYKGGSQLITDVIGGELDAGVVTVSTVQSLGRERILPLAVTTARRDPALPEVETFAEGGVRGYEADFWFGLLAPKGTPRTIVDKLNAAARQALADPEVRKQHLALGFSGSGSTPDEFSRVIAHDFDKWGKVLASIR